MFEIEYSVDGRFHSVNLSRLFILSPVELD